MVGFGFFVLIVLVIIWMFKRAQSTSNGEEVRSNYLLSEEAIRYKVAAEIRAQLPRYKSAAQHKVVEEMAMTVEYFAVNPYAVSVERVSTEEHEQIAEQPSEPEEVSYAYDPSKDIGGASEETVVVRETAPATQVATASSEPYETPWKKIQFLDGAVILLYLGAFFVLASIGLYIGLGSGTTIKAILAAIIAAVFYVGGITLYRRSARLKPAGQTFVAIGMATVPMAGAALYYYAFSQSHGPAVWLMTSLIMLAVYAHALYVLRSPLVSYLIIFSSISLVLSGVSSVGLAPYYFIQGLGFAGIIFALISRLLPNNTTQIRESYEQSASFLVPFSVGLSVLFFNQIGYAQLTFSLLMSTLYYLYAAIDSQKNRQAHILATQFSGISMLLCGTYALFSRLTLLAGVAMFVSLLYSVTWAVWARLRQDNDAYKMQIVGFMYGLPTVALFIFTTHYSLLWVPVVVLFAQGLLMYSYQRDIVSGVTWLASLLALPVLIGELAFGTPVSAVTLGISYASLLLAGLLADMISPKKLTTIDVQLQELLLGISLGVSGLLFLTATNMQQGVLMAVHLAALTVHSLRSKLRDQWLSAAALVQLCWLVVFFDSARVFTGMVLFVGIFNVAILAWKKYSFHEWLALVAFLCVPALYIGFIHNATAKPEYFLWAYALLCIVFLIVRLSDKVFSKTAAYFGYIMSFMAALVGAFLVGPWVALGVFLVASLALLYFEKLEEDRTFGFLAPLLPLAVLFTKNCSVGQMAWVISATTVLAIGMTLYKKRTYESALGTIGLIVLPWFLFGPLGLISANVTAGIYAALAALFLLVRYGIEKTSYVTAFKATLLGGYLVALVLAILSTDGFWVTGCLLLFGTALLLVAERIEKEASLGFVAVLLPLWAFTVTSATHVQLLLVLLFVTILSLALTFLRKRSFEAFVAVAGLLIVPFYADVIVYEWGVPTLVFMYTGLSCAFVLCRKLLSAPLLKSAIQTPLMVGYAASLTFGVMASVGGSWQLCSFSLFATSVLLVAISYIESSAEVITLAFLGAYAFVWRFAAGLGMSLSSIMLLYVILSQAVYWILAVSKLDTRRAQISRYFQLVVASCIPWAGVFSGDSMHIMYPLAGVGFAGMLLYELWQKGQSAREASLLVAHASLLWMLYVLGVREVQVYTQLTAAVIAGFAYWRRKLHDAPAVINQYVWVAVLTFSLPMIYQALTSGNIMYAYLVLVEHVILTVLSIALKRATFAWWGIAVIVGSVLYQFASATLRSARIPRRLHYLAGVYFLLKYNKPAGK